MQDIPILRKNGIELILTINGFKVLDKEFEILDEAKEYLAQKAEEKTKNNR